MIAYRAFAQNVQKRIGLAFDDTLATVSVALKAIAQQLDDNDTKVKRQSLAPELKQVMVPHATVRREGQFMPSATGVRFISKIENHLRAARVTGSPW